MFSPKSAATARLAKQIEKTKREAPHRSYTASDELPDKIYNKRVGESLEFERFEYTIEISLSSL